MLQSKTRDFGSFGRRAVIMLFGVFTRNACSLRKNSSLLRNFRIYGKVCSNFSYAATVKFHNLPTSKDALTRRLYSDFKKDSVHMKVVKGREIFQEVIEKKRDILIEKKNVLVRDIRETKSKVKEKVREKVEEVIERENILTIPNFLTVGRGLLAPYLGLVIIQQDFTLAMVLLIAAGITDLLDGQIARRWPKQASKFGSFLDPLADKLLMGSLVISLGYCDLLPIWLAGMILFRDVFLVAAGFVIRYISLPPPKTLSRYFDATHATAQLEPTFISKVNTGVQLLTIGLSLGAPIWNYIDHPALHGLWYLTGATTVAAAVSYITNKNTYKILQKSKNNDLPDT